MDIDEMQRKLSLWAEQRLLEPEKGLFASRKDLRLYDLYHLLYDPNWLRLAHDHVARNSGSITAGCDGINMARFDKTLGDNLQRLAEELRTQNFRACPVRRVNIPKKDGKLRPLGIPSIRDRIVQEALRMVLEPIFEAEFYKYSYGFRPNRSTIDALAMIAARTNPQNKFYWVIEGDIKSYFDTINHKKLMQLLRRRIKDKKLQRLIWRFLKAGVMEGKLFKDTEQGTPQGGIISPLLANVYLHELDMFMTRYAQLPQKERATRRNRGLGNFFHIRYADDFVVLCNGTREEAEAMRGKLQKFLAEELKLTLSMEKTKITHIDDGFKFLGYNISRSVAGNGKKVRKFLIPGEARKKLRAAIMLITAPSTCDNSVNAKISALNLHLRGWANHYRYAYNATKVFRNIDHFAFWQMAHWLGRKFKCSMPNVMQRFYRKVEGKMTLANDGFSVMRMSSISPIPLRNRTFENPYSSDEQEVTRTKEFGVDCVWTGTERRPGLADIRSLVLKRDGWLCQRCRISVDYDTVEIHHIRPVKQFRKPTNANKLSNLQTLCRTCHKVKTMSMQQMESRMQ